MSSPEPPPAASADATAPILVPTDFSEPSAAALTAAEALARVRGARILLVHAFYDSDYFLGRTLGLDQGQLEEFHAAARSAAARRLESLGEASRARGALTETVLRDGRAAETVTAAAREFGAGLIVLPTHGRSGIRRLFLGSVAEKLVRLAPCPVLVLHRMEAAAEGSERTVVCATDFSAPSELALHQAETAARERGATLLIVHVFTASEYAPGIPGDPAFELAGPEVQACYDAARAGVDRQLAAAVDAVRARGLRVDSLVVHGRAPEQIVEAARNAKAELIVLATHGWTGWRRFVLGSTAEEVARTAPCPVLVVRGAEPEASAPAA